MYPKKKFERGGNRFGGGFGGGGRGNFGKTQLYGATCIECGNECEVPFKPMGNRPVFCRNCFRKPGEEAGPRYEAPRYESRGSEDKLMYPAVCATCQNDCKVPFRPTEGRPVYCHRCMAAQNGGPAPVSSAAPSGASKMSDDQFKTLNAKLDKILKILELATADVDSEDEEVEFEEEAPTPKAPKKKPTRGQVKRAKRTGKA